MQVFESKVVVLLRERPQACRLLSSLPTAYCLLPTPDRSDSHRLAAEPGDLVGVLVAAPGEADDEGLARAEARGFRQRQGQGVARFEGGEDALGPGGGVVGVEGLGVGDALVADAA